VSCVALALGGFTNAPIWGAPLPSEQPDPLPDGSIARLGTVRLRYAGGVGKLALLSDGKTLVTGGGDGSVRFWDVKTGKQLRRREGYGSVIDAMEVSTDCKLVAAGGVKFSIRLVENGDALPQAQGNISGGVPVVLSPDGNVLAFAANGSI